MARPALLGLALFLARGFLAACTRQSSPPFETHVCWIAPTGGGYARLDPDVANLETCGARLEVVYLQHKRPVTGSYGGVYVYVDASSIDAAAPNGPREELIDPANRRRIDTDIQMLDDARAADAGR